MTDKNQLYDGIRHELYGMWEYNNRSRSPLPSINFSVEEKKDMLDEAYTTAVDDTGHQYKIIAYKKEYTLIANCNGLALIDNDNVRKVSDADLANYLKKLELNPDEYRVITENKEKEYVL